MRNFRLILRYDGTDYNGWQSQPDQRTIQQTLEDAIRTVTGDERIFANASGRTDSGVHAVGQVVNFHSNTKLAPDVVLRAVNNHLPRDVVIVACEEAPPEFDANRDAKRKLYRYVIHDHPVPDPFLRRFCCHSRHRLDADLMRQSAQALKGTHDFRCFETEWPNRASSVRTITHLAISRAGDWIWLDVEADGFLYNMVRAIAGTLMYVGRRFWPVERVAQLIQGADRTQAGPTAPARGLFLMRVTYQE